MYTCLNEEKTAQIAARFLGKPGVDSDNYTKLVKLLYLCDREAMERWGQPLTGDKYYWVKRGPILSGVLDRIKGKLAKKTYWDTCFETVRYTLRVRNAPGDDMLSEPERALIDELADRYRDFTYGQMINFAHTLPECPPDSDGGSRVLTYERILASLGKGEESPRIAEDIEACNYLRSKIGAPC